MSETLSEFMASLSKESLYAWRSRALAAEAEADRLRAEVQKLDSECTDLATDLNTQRQDNASLAEPWKVVNPLQAEASRLAAENEKLRAALREAYEIYANSDGFIPETAAEGYQQHIIKQMVDCIAAAIRKLGEE